MKILVAEDSELLQEIAIEFIDSWGYKSDIASNGQEAFELAIANEGKYDLCLMDIDMPVMNGCDATRMIRQRTKYFPVMALTANMDIKDIYSEVGMDDYLAKPYSPNQLYDKINELTVKSEKVYIHNDEILIKKEMPMDQKHLQELKQLKKQGLVKLRLDGPEEREVVTHKNIPNKISHDFNIKKYVMTEFLNRDTERPTVCDLYRGNKSCIVETFLDEEDYIERMKKEDADAGDYIKKIFLPDEE